MLKTIIQQGRGGLGRRGVGWELFSWQAAQNDFSARPQKKQTPQAYPSHPPSPEPAKASSFPVVGYAEDVCEARTPLEVIFNSLSVAHFGAGRIGATHHQLNADQFMTMRTFGTNRVLVQIFEIRLLGPH